ncbi:EamA family transporter, partial [Acinetobacter baumannii]
GVSLRITHRECRDLAICAIGFSATPILLLSSYHYLPSGLATTIHFVYPTLVLAGCVLFRHEKLTLRKVVCCILCTVGVISF